MQKQDILHRGCTALICDFAAHLLEAQSFDDRVIRLESRARGKIYEEIKTSQKVKSSNRYSLIANVPTTQGSTDLFTAPQLKSGEDTKLNISCA